ncbi:hypothetical protein K3172_12845 [Qipengyuania sp. 6B39]|nr:hypothetical protein [Qipengyuania proteolytica]MBX7496746.1 hypothetical protein [Qipengyuania proteolytica]
MCIPGDPSRAFWRGVRAWAWDKFVDNLTLIIALIGAIATLVIIGGMQ